MVKSSKGDWRTNWNTGVYTREDCLSFIEKFFRENGKIPTCNDIRRMSKKKESPSTSVFERFGGIPHLAETMDLPVNNKGCEEFSHGEVRCIMISWINSFIKLNGGIIPLSKDFYRELPVSAGLLKRYYRTYRNCLIVLGFSGVRRGKKLNNMPSIFK